MGSPSFSETIILGTAIAAFAKPASKNWCLSYLDNLLFAFFCAFFLHFLSLVVRIGRLVAFFLAFAVFGCFSNAGLLHGIDDAAITSKIVALLVSDPKMENSGIKVVTDEGEVYLLGRVADFEKRRRADAHARGVDGVWSVINALKTGRPPKLDSAQNDSAITRAMLEGMQKAGISVFSGVKVYSFEQELYLIGRLDTKKNYKKVLEIAAGLSGVLEIHDYLKYGSI